MAMVVAGAMAGVMGWAMVGMVAMAVTIVAATLAAPQRLLLLQPRQQWQPRRSPLLALPRKHVSIWILEKNPNQKTGSG